MPPFLLIIHTALEISSQRCKLSHTSVFLHIIRLKLLLKTVKVSVHLDLIEIGLLIFNQYFLSF